jgi:CPA2 family monovalent cation:H+ antiporter-2
MITGTLFQILLLLGVSVTMVLAFQKLRMPPTVGYLLVGVILGPYTIGPVIDGRQIQAVAEFGIVFLLFTIGLSFSLPQLRTMRSTVFGLGFGQVVMTTALIGLLGWLAGLPPAAAFVVGAVFAQSSTTIISKQLVDQGEDQSRHGRLGIALSVFQDITAVPFIVVIPALGAAGVAVGSSLGGAVGIELALALGKGTLAFVVLFVIGRSVLHPLFHLIAERRSAELFTLTVLLVSLCAAGLTELMGLSLAFGAFLAGMLLGETEFRHQVEATIRPFRDVLLGAFFISIGMLFDPGVLPQIWIPAFTAALALLAIKILLVTGLARLSGIDMRTALRTGILLAVGGEFGFALLAIGVDHSVMEAELVQIAFTAVLLSMAAAPFLIRYNHTLARLLTGGSRRVLASDAKDSLEPAGELRDHVIICGYGRIGQSVGHSLEQEGIRYVALDLDPARVREARMAGEPVYFADASDPTVLDSVGLQAARLLLISHGDVAASHRILRHARAERADLPVMVRTRDEAPAESLRAAGATEVVPETLEASLMIASHVLLLLDVPLPHVIARMQRQWSNRYRLLRSLFLGDSLVSNRPGVTMADHLEPVELAARSPGVGQRLGDLLAEGVVASALARQGRRDLNPAADTRLEPGDVVVLFGAPDGLKKTARRLLGR